LDVAQFISQFGYWAVLLGTLIEGETFVVLAGLAASRGYLNAWAVIAVATFGSIVSYQTCFQLGRRVGPKIISGIPNSAIAADRVRRLAERYPALLIVGIHFLYGVRTVGLFVIGMSGVAGWKFFALNILGSVIWATTVTMAGYVFGNAITAVLGDIDRYDHFVFGGLLVLAVMVWGVFRLRRRWSTAPTKL
jgi:membrane protein DedA with SNARE-associated domain